MCHDFNSGNLHNYWLYITDPEYIVSVPLFDEVDFKLSNGRTFVIRRHGEGEKITRITVGGKKLKGWFLQDEDMRAGLPLDIYVNDVFTVK